MNVTFKTETCFDQHHCNPGCNIYLYIEIIWIKLHDMEIKTVSKRVHQKKNQYVTVHPLKNACSY